MKQMTKAVMPVTGMAWHFMMFDRNQLIKTLTVGTEGKRDLPLPEGSDTNQIA